MCLVLCQIWLKSYVHECTVAGREFVIDAQRIWKLCMCVCSARKVFLTVKEGIELFIGIIEMKGKLGFRANRRWWLLQVIQAILIIA